VQGQKELLKAMQAGKVEEAAAILELQLDKQYQGLLHPLAETDQAGCPG
jgi:hypothetical protein